MISVNQQEEIQLSQIFPNHLYIEMDVLRENINLKKNET